MWYNTHKAVFPPEENRRRRVYEMEMVFYRCEHCGQIVAVVKKTGVPIMCCGQPMKEIVPGTTDASVEKHVPIYAVENGVVTVTVGSVAHPMLPDRYGQWLPRRSPKAP